MYPDYSVLMSVYVREKAEYLKLAMESMFTQSLPPKEFVLVCDGPLNHELDSVIEKYKEAYPQLLRVLRLEQNVGLGNALKIGVQNCQNELIARMDSDDISVKDRCRLQVEYFVKHQDVSLISGQIAEFENNPAHITGIRSVPCEPEAVLAFARKRNPMNHMAVMYKKSEVLRAGNYEELNLGEDYYLWVRMLCQGTVAANLPETLVSARGGAQMYQRRGGFSYVKKMCTLQKKFYRLGFISFREYILNCCIRSVISILSPGLREKIYRSKLRM